MGRLSTGVRRRALAGTMRRPPGGEAPHHGTDTTGPGGRGGARLAARHQPGMVT